MKKPAWYSNPMYSTGKLPEDTSFRWNPLPAVPLYLFNMPADARKRLYKILESLAVLVAHFPFERFDEAYDEVMKIADEKKWMPDAPGIHVWRACVKIVISEKADVIDWKIRTWTMPVAEYIGTRVYARVVIPKDLVDYYMGHIKTIVEARDGYHHLDHSWEIRPMIDGILGDYESLLWVILKAYDEKYGNR